MNRFPRWQRVGTFHPVVPALALAAADEHPRARKLASGSSTSRRTLVSALLASQPANDTGETSAFVCDFAAESLIWTSKDVSRFLGGLNLYGYCENDPINCVDVTGRTPTGAGCAHDRVRARATRRNVVAAGQPFRAEDVFAPTTRRTMRDLRPIFARG